MSPDGEAIVTGAGDETLRFWNVFSKTRSTKVCGVTDSCGDFRPVPAMTKWGFPRKPTVSVCSGLLRTIVQKNGTCWRLDVFPTLNLALTFLAI